MKKDFNAYLDVWDMFTLSATKRERENASLTQKGTLADHNMLFYVMFIYLPVTKIPFIYYRNLIKTYLCTKNAVILYCWFWSRICHKLFQISLLDKTFDDKTTPLSLCVCLKIPFTLTWEYTLSRMAFQRWWCCDFPTSTTLLTTFKATKCQDNNSKEKNTSYTGNDSNHPVLKRFTTSLSWDRNSWYWNSHKTPLEEVYM